MSTSGRGEETLGNGTYRIGKFVLTQGKVLVKEHSGRSG